MVLTVCELLRVFSFSFFFFLFSFGFFVFIGVESVPHVCFLHCFSSFFPVANYGDLHGFYSFFVFAKIRQVFAFSLFSAGGADAEGEEEEASEKKDAAGFTLALRVFVCMDAADKAVRGWDY